MCVHRVCEVSKLPLLEAGLYDARILVVALNAARPHLLALRLLEFPATGPNLSVGVGDPSFGEFRQIRCWRKRFSSRYSTRAGAKVQGSYLNEFVSIVPEPEQAPTVFKSSS